MRINLNQILQPVPNMWVLYIATAAAFLLDQASKVFVLWGLNLPQVGQIEIAPPYLNFRMAWNYGMNFGLFAQDSPMTRWILITVAMALIGFVSIWIRYERPRKIVMLAAGLLIGGALGNVIDRAIHGAVVDFLNMSCCGINNPYAFNIADVEIFIGAVGLALFGDQKNAT